MTDIYAKRGLVVGVLVFIALLAVFFITGTIEWWAALVVCGGAYAIGHVLTPYLEGRSAV